MPKEFYRVLTYEQALDLVLPHLQKLKSDKQLKKFCRENGLSYFIVQLMSTNHHRQFPDSLHTLLEVFGYKTEREKAFKVFDQGD
jgi:hypothetical protein